MTLMSVSSSDEEDDFRSRPRWSANKKIDVVMRLLRGEPIEDVSRRLGWRCITWRRGGTTSSSRARRGQAAADRGGSPVGRGGTQDRRVDDGERDPEAGDRKNGAPDPASEAAEIAMEGSFPLARVCEVLDAPRSTVYHRRRRGDALGCRPGPTTDMSDDELVVKIRRDLPSRCPGGITRPSASTRSRTRCPPTPTPRPAGHTPNSGPARHPQGRLVGQHQLRCHHLPGRQQVPPPVRRGESRGRHRGDLQDGKLLTVHATKHDPAKAHGAFANPGGRPGRANAAS